MLFDQIPKDGLERLAFLAFRQDPGDVAGNGICPSRTHLLVDSRQLIFGQAN